ncbi:lipopolysaccharide biosynthesis protein [Mucilaginibacter corticis]|uniref:Lipopolysaccharide biosynthesis protein n=1 Tax=Mucilaginibacter corticis TaxID=2597670 RepID=A0A556MKE3_9SPHI|nr:lipopolysaccharide biosynthesis protein [Mucilaginibacter corticis]TSJ40295.1 lipopolysaccharide biosynthesis protein [Mucilaginibacter corticis]
MDKTNQRFEANNSDEISLKEVVLKIKEWYRFILSKWKVILIGGFIGGILGLTYSYLKKTIYKAELSFALEDEKSSGGGLGAAMGLASQFGIDLGGGNSGGVFSEDNLLELMKSRSMVENTLLTAISINGQQQTLAELYISFNKYRPDWSNKPALKNIRFLPNADRSKFSLQQDSILGVFYKDITKNNLTVDRTDKKSTIITVKVNSKNELFSKFFTEILAKTVSDFYVETKTKKSVQNVAILQRQTDSVRHELNAAITGVASSGDLNPNPNPALQILRVPSQHRQIDVQANQAILTQLVANLELSKIALRKETPLIQVIDKPILPLEKDQFGKAKGFVLGMFILIFVTTFYLVIVKFLKSII